MSCRPLMNKAPPFEGLNMRIPIVIPMKRRGLIYKESTLGFKSSGRGTEH